MKHTITNVKRLIILLCAIFISSNSFGQLKISQVYGGGGNASATYNKDFVEIFNPTTSSVTVTNWAIQQASAAGSSWAVQSFSATIPAGKYFLISLAGGATGANLPTPDLVGSAINIAAGSGKIFLTNSTTLLVGTCPTSAAIVDYVGFGGTANCSEGAVATGPANNTTSLLRASGGCTDANNNSTDFSVGSVNPRNSASPANSCTVSPTATTDPATVTSSTAATLNGTVNANGASTAITFEYGTSISYGTTVGGTPSPLTSSSATAVSAGVTGLLVNTQYNYRVVATAVGAVNGSNVTFYTFANVPNAPTVTNPTTSSLDVTVGSGDGNPGTTEYAIQETGSSNYVQASGALGATAVWLTASAWGTKTVTGLASNSPFTFQVKARNGALVETAFGASASGSTTASGTPAITITGSIAPFYTVAGTPSASQNYSISGSLLTNDIIITPTANFEISLDNSTWVDNSSFITLTQSGGIVNPTTIYIHFVSATAGTFSGSIGHTTVGGAPQTISLNGTAYSTEPSIASNVTFGTTSATAMTINFSGGNGASRIVVLKAGSAVGFVPVDGNSVSGVNADFSIAANQGGGDRIVYDGTGNTVNVTGLSAATTYHVAVYEYNGTAPTINYFATPGIGNNTTIVAEPTTASVLTFGSISTNSMVLNFTGGNGTSRIVVAHDNTAVTFTPADLTGYTGINSDFSSAADQGSGNKIVYDGTGTTVTVTGLTQGVAYFYVVYEYNGSGATSNYLLSPNGSNSATTVGPWPYSVTGSTYSQTFNGLPSSTGTFTISSNPSYISTTPVNATGMGGWQIGATASTPKFFVGDGSTNTAGNYSLGTGTATERALGAIASGTTVSNLGIVLKNTTTDVLTNVTITFTGEQWRRGSGAANVLSFKYSVGGSDLLTGTFTSEPLLNFTSPVTSGTDVALNGNVAPNRTAVSASIVLNANWLPGQTLVLRWDDANDGGNDDMLAIDDFTFVATGPTTPTIQDNNISFASVLTTSLTASWLNGDGINHLVKMNTSNSFTDPVDGNSYTANSVFANSGEQVVYDGTGSTVNITGLTAGTNYFFRVYGYNGSGSGSKYLTTIATLNPNDITTAAPSSATQVVILDVNGGVSPTVNQPFTVTVQAQDGAGSPQTVSLNTTVQLSVWSGFGNLSGTVSGDILSGTSTLTITGVIYDAADFGVQLDASVIAGDPLTSNQSALFDVLDVASNLAFSTTPTTGIANTNLSNIVVQARRPDATLDPSYSGAITLSVASGPGTISGTVTVNAINGQATFTGIQLSTSGTYTLQATATGLSAATSGSILITGLPTLSELVVPQYIGCKSLASATNNDRTPIAICIQIDNLIPNTAYDLRAGIDSATVTTGYGGGNLWTGAAFSGSSITNAFTTDALGSSGPVWIFAQPATSRFEPGIQHTIRIGYAITGSGLPTTPNFIGSKLITALDIPSTARTVSTADDGAFLKGTASTCLSGKYVLVYDNVAGTGDPLYSYQIRTSIPTAGSVSGLPTSIGDVYAQNGTSAIGDYAAVIPIGANNPNGVRRIEARNSSNSIVSFQTDDDGIWPSGANTTTITRRGVAVLTLSDAPLNTLAVTTSTTPATCVGTNDGTATATATGIGTLTYSWNTTPVQTTSTITGLSSGTYIVTVTDGSGCSTTASAVVGQPAASTITADGPTTFCDPGSVTLSAGSGVGYTYLWSTGETTQSILVTSTGSYSVTVNNGAGCIQTSLATNVTVNTFNFTGTIYTENMGTPTGTTAIINNVFQNGAPISYTSTSTTPTDVRITNPSTGSGSGNVFFGSSVAAPTRNFIISGINTQGASGLVLSFLLKRDNSSSDIMTLETSTDGITWNPLSFTTPSALTWTLITINTGIPSAANLRLRFSKTSTSTAFRLDDVKITSTMTSVTPSASGTLTLCPGASVILTSNIPSSNTWSPNGETTKAITVNTAGSYTVTAVGSNGCSATSSPIVVQTVSAPVVTVTSTDVTCNGGNNGTASASVTSGTSPYSYSWSTTPVQTTDIANTLTAGNYSVVVTDVNGCSASQSTTINQPTVLSASSTQDAAIACNGGTTTVTVAASGGTAPYIGTGTFTVAAGTHNYTVLDANGCVANTSITVSEPSVVVATVTQTAAILCNGGTATITVTGSGGTAPYSGEGTFTVTAGTYNYTLTDASGCVGSTSITVTEPTALSATSSATTIVCFGGSSTVTVSASGGTSPYTGTGSFTVGAGTYTYTVTDANGCTATTSITVTEPAQVVVTATETSSIVCPGGNATITVSATGGDGNYTGTGTFTVTAGTYNYNVTDGNGCSGSASITVADPAAVGVSSFTPTSGCVGSTVSIFGSNLNLVTAIDLNGISAIFVLVNSGEITVTVPPTATSGVFNLYTASNCITTTASNYTVTTCSSGMTINLTAYLQGYYLGSGTMQPVLLNQAVAGATGAETDTITVQLWTWDGINTPVLTDETKSVLMTDGSAVAVFNSAPAGNYYIAIRHRSSINTWSSVEVAMGTTPASYDFSSAATQAMGDNMTQLPSDPYWTIYSGDLNGDDFVDIFDYPSLDADNYNFVFFDYVNTDINGDGFVDIFDYPILDENNFNFVFAQHP